VCGKRYDHTVHPSSKKARVGLIVREKIKPSNFALLTSSNKHHFPPVKGTRRMGRIMKEQERNV
jgi:hypothetical protein